MSIEAMKQALEALEDARLHIFLGDKKGVEANIRANYAYESLRQAIAEAELEERRKLLPRCFADYQPNHAVYRSCEWCAVKTECQTGDGIENLHKM
jgi:hypothetical protein